MARKRLYEAFELFDESRSGTMPRSELPLLLSVVGVPDPDLVLCRLMGVAFVDTGGRRDSLVQGIVAGEKLVPSRKASLDEVKPRRRHSLAGPGEDVQVLAVLTDEDAKAVRVWPVTSKGFTSYSGEISAAASCGFSISYILATRQSIVAPGQSIVDWAADE